MSDKTITVVPIAQVTPNAQSIEAPEGEPVTLTYSQFGSYKTETGKVSHAPDGVSDAKTTTVYRGPAGRVVVSR